MRIGFYIHHSMLKAGGIYTYSIGILRLIIKQKEIDKIVIITTSEVKQAMLDLVDNSKVEFNLLNRESFINKIKLFLSFFLLRYFYHLSAILPKEQSLNRIKSLSNFINPYRTIINKVTSNYFTFQFSMHLYIKLLCQ